MSLISRLAKRRCKGRIINVAVTGAGFIGRGIVFQIDRTPGMKTALIVNRNTDPAVEAYLRAWRSRDDIIVSDDPYTIQQAINTDRAAVTTRADMLRELEGIEVVVEATGAVEYGAQVAIHAIEGAKHVVMMNAETDATVGCALKQRADQASVVYTNSDGDQPGVLRRLCDYVNGINLDVVAAINCKGFMDVNATPETIKPWAEKQNTSLPMTTAFTDGTKMNIENAVLANSTGLVPDCRGMRGVKTTSQSALEDCLAVFSRRGVVDYTLGGDFGGGVFVIGHSEDAQAVQPYMQYLKMGPGPNYLFFRPYHLCHFETPLSIAEVALDNEPTIAPLGSPVAEVITIAKRDLTPGEALDGIGGYTCYGEIDTAANAAGLLPIGLAENAVLTRPITKGAPIPFEAVEINHDSILMRLRQEQSPLAEAA